MSNRDGRAIVADVIARPLPEVAITSVGMVINRPISFEEWQDMGPGIEAGHRAYSLAAGDWLVYGEQHFPDRYEQAMDATGLSLGRLRNLASTCGRVSHQARQWAKSISHMESVASFDEQYQIKFLQLSQEYELDRDTFRVLMQQVKEGKDPDLLKVESGAIVVLPPKVTKDAIIEHAKSVVINWQYSDQSAIEGPLQHALSRLEEILGDQI